MIDDAGRIDAELPKKTRRFDTDIFDTETINYDPGVGLGGFDAT